MDSFVCFICFMCFKINVCMRVRCTFGYVRTSLRWVAGFIKRKQKRVVLCILYPKVPPLHYSTNFIFFNVPVPPCAQRVFPGFELCLCYMWLSIAVTRNITGNVRRNDVFFPFLLFALRCAEQTSLFFVSITFFFFPIFQLFHRLHFNSILFSKL